MVNRSYDLDERLLDVAVSVCKITKAFPNDRLGVHVGSQLVRSGTAPAANYAEAQAAESRRDFIHKLKISLKGLRESLVWLRLAKRMDSNTGRHLNGALQECDELIAIFGEEYRDCWPQGIYLI
jgi:four helix bundle protein